jgi:hypothetical protein
MTDPFSRFPYRLLTESECSEWDVADIVWGIDYCDRWLASMAKSIAPQSLADVPKTDMLTYFITVARLNRARLQAASDKKQTSD